MICEPPISSAPSSLKHTMPKRFHRMSLYKISHVRSWPKDACCLKNTPTYTLLDKLMQWTLLVTFAIQLVTDVMSRGSVKGWKRAREGKPKGPETSREKSSKSLCWIIDPPSLPTHRSIHYAYSHLSKCKEYWRCFQIDDIWIMHNILSVGHDNSHRMMNGDVLLNNHI